MIDFENIAIPVYGLTLSDASNISDFINQFHGKTEFDLTIIATSITDFWNAVQDCVRKSMKDGDELIIICSERHSFTKDYHRDIFFKDTIRTQGMGCDILLIGTNGFNHAVPISDTLFWIDKFENAEFIVIYRKLFNKILENHITHPTISNCLSHLASNIICTTPFMSLYSRKTSLDQDGEMIDNFSHESYHIASEKLSLYSKIYTKYH